MKRVLIFALGICFIMGSTHYAHAWPWDKKQATEKPAPAVPPAKPAAPEAAKPAKPAVPAQPDAKAQEEAFRLKRVLAQKKMIELNNTEWQIELLPMSGKGKKEFDTVTFKNNQVSIASYVKKGFPFTNFTLTVQDNGLVIWETMQTSEKSGVAFWRGELESKMDVMRGVVSYQLDKKTKMDYSFASTGKKNIPMGK